MSTQALLWLAFLATVLFLVICVVYMQRSVARPRTFPLSRVDGSLHHSNGCATGSVTIEESDSTYFYTVRTPAGTFVTDVYVLEVGHTLLFPLTPDGCSVDLSRFGHARLDRVRDSHQARVSSRKPSGRGKCVLISLLVVYSSISDRSSHQMMTFGSCNGAKPIPLMGECLINPCPTGTCCDPVIPSYVSL